MKACLALVLSVVALSSLARADYGDSADRNEILAIATGRSAQGTPSHARHVDLKPDASGCSNAGDEVARPVYATIDGVVTFLGYECVQDNRGGNGG